MYKSKIFIQSQIYVQLEWHRNVYFYFLLKVTRVRRVLICGLFYLTPSFIIFIYYFIMWIQFVNTTERKCYVGFQCINKVIIIITSVRKRERIDSLLDSASGLKMIKAP